MCWPALLLPLAKASTGGCQMLREAWLPGTFLHGTASLQNRTALMLPPQCVPKATLEIISTHLMPLPPREMHDESDKQ